MSLGVISALIVAFVIGIAGGAILFPKHITKYVSNDDGNFCYDKDMELYGANNLNYIPEGIFGMYDCMAINLEYEECYIAEVCPDCVTNKVACVCRKK